MFVASVTPGRRCAYHSAPAEWLARREPSGSAETVSSRGQNERKNTGRGSGVVLKNPWVHPVPAKPSMTITLHNSLCLGLNTWDMEQVLVAPDISPDLNARAIITQCNITITKYNRNLDAKSFRNKTIRHKSWQIRRWVRDENDLSCF